MINFLEKQVQRISRIYVFKQAFHANDLTSGPDLLQLLLVKDTVVGLETLRIN